jgi:hypothetical protein
MNETSAHLPANRGLPEDCLSDLTLDRLRCADLPEAAATSATTHLQACERCQVRARTLAADTLALGSELPDLDALLQRRVGPAENEPVPGENVTSINRIRARTRRWWVPALAVLSAAAAIALFIGRSPEPSGEIRLKGVSGELDLFVRRGKKVFRWQTESLQPGDQLRYSFRAPEPLHVMVLSREASGAVNQYFPAEPSSFAVDLGVTLSKNATELDATLGAETLWAIFCPKPFTADGFVSQLQSGGVIAPGDGCATQRLEFTKVAP